MGDVLLVSVKQSRFFVQISAFSTEDEIKLTCDKLLSPTFDENLMAYEVVVGPKCVLGFDAVCTYLPIGCYNLHGKTYVVPPTRNHLLG